MTRLPHYGVPLSTYQFYNETPRKVNMQTNANNLFSRLTKLHNTDSNVITLMHITWGRRMSRGAFVLGVLSGGDCPGADVRGANVRLPVSSRSLITLVYKVWQRNERARETRLSVLMRRSITSRASDAAEMRSCRITETDKDRRAKWQRKPSGSRLDRGGQRSVWRQ